MSSPLFVFDFPDDPGGSAEASGNVTRRVFSSPVSMIVASTVADVVPALRRVEAAVAAGYWAAGFLCYEAAPAFEPAMRVRDGGRMPLLMFGVFGEPASSVGVVASADAPVLSWVEDTPPESFLHSISQIHEAIAAGETYQVNYTTRLHASVAVSESDSFPLYEQLRAAQGSGFHAYLQTSSASIVSVSPELFFSRRGSQITTRPMKGTRPRGRWTDEDFSLRSELASSPKDRAENLMIVDLLRNDIGRVCEAGSVHVPSLFGIEQYETVWQMTSTITGTVRSSVSLVDIFSALFPCGSVTGAPKINTMKWIAALEDSPREIYCGAIGFIRPGGDCVFSVPIRTLWIDHDSDVATYGVGSGVTIDSIGEAELEELRDKAEVLRIAPPTTFSLFETMYYDGSVFVRVDRHMERMKQSALFFDFVFDGAAALACLQDAVVGGTPARVRLVLDRNGAMTVDVSRDVPARSNVRDTIVLPERVVLARTPVSPRDVFLCHKTTHRASYDTRREPDAFDTLVWNTRGEVTEFTIGNVVLEIDGGLVTPARTSGLLNGTFRAELLDSGVVNERVVGVSELERCTRMWLVNSVREWVEVRMDAKEFPWTAR